MYMISSLSITDNPNRCMLIETVTNGSYWCTLSFTTIFYNVINIIIYLLPSLLVDFDTELLVYGVTEILIDSDLLVDELVYIDGEVFGLRLFNSLHLQHQVLVLEWVIPTEHPLLPLL